MLAISDLSAGRRIFVLSVRDSSYYYKPLPDRTAIDIWECYALGVLRHFFPERHSGLAIVDKPDLVDEVLDVGVEVTWAISREEQEARSLYTKLPYVKDEATRTRYLERIEQNGAVCKEGFLFGPKGTDSYSLVLEAYEKKLDKLNKGGYRVFSCNELFILSNIYAVDRMREAALSRMQDLKISKSIQFANVYVSVPGFIYVFDLDTNEYRTVEFSGEEQYQIAKRAHEDVLIDEMRRHPTPPNGDLCLLVCVSEVKDGVAEEVFTQVSVIVHVWVVLQKLIGAIGDYGLPQGSESSCPVPWENAYRLLMVLHSDAIVPHHKRLEDRERLMNQSVIDAVLTAMQQSLNSSQLKKLKSVLASTLDTHTMPSNESESKALLEAFLTAKELEGCTERTLKYYESTLRHFLNEVATALTQVSTETLRTYLMDYQGTHDVGKVTIDNIRRILSSFFSWLEDEDYIVKSPARKIHHIKAPVRVKETISDEDMERLRDGCETIRDLAIIDLLASTGMRVGELVKLDRASVNLNERECVVQGKGNKERCAYFDARAKLHLEDYLSSRSDANPALFVSLAGSHDRLTIGSVEERLRSLGRKLELPRIHPHKFRRTMATNAINRGMPIEQVQKLLGHVKIDTTMEYALVSQSNVKASHRRYLG